MYRRVHLPHRGTLQHILAAVSTTRSRGRRKKHSGAEAEASSLPNESRQLGGLAAAWLPSAFRRFSGIQLIVELIFADFTTSRIKIADPRRRPSIKNKPFRSLPRNIRD